MVFYSDIQSLAGHFSDAVDYVIQRFGKIFHNRVWPSKVIVSIFNESHFRHVARRTCTFSMEMHDNAFTLFVEINVAQNYVEIQDG